MEVTQLAVDPYGDDAAVIAEEIEAGRGSVGHPLLPVSSEAMVIDMLDTMDSLLCFGAG